MKTSRLASLALAAVVIVAGCSDGGELEELRAENAQLQEQLDSLLASASATPTATPAPSPTATKSPTRSTTPTPSPTPTDPPTPTVEPTPAPGQFSIVTHWFTSNSIGTPEVHITILNEGPELIDAFDVRICAFDAYGDPVKDYGYGSHCFTGVASDERIPAGTQYTATWVLYGQDFATSAEVSPVRSHTSGGSTWRGR